MLVVDASIVVSTLDSGRSFDWLDDDPHAPALMWSEVRATLHRSTWRGVLSRERGLTLLDRLHRCKVRAHRDGKLGAEAWRIADELGWAKTYDAEFVALARLERAKVLTTDGRLRRGADRTGLVISPTEL